jgi:hypothetical protein
MHKHGSIVCKWRPCLPKGPTNSAQMCTIVTASLQRQYLQTELILWMRLVHGSGSGFSPVADICIILAKPLKTNMRELFTTFNFNIKV